MCVWWWGGDPTKPNTFWLVKDRLRNRCWKKVRCFLFWLSDLKEKQCKQIWMAFYQCQHVRVNITLHTLLFESCQKYMKVQRNPVAGTENVDNYCPRHVRQLPSLVGAPCWALSALHAPNNGRGRYLLVFFGSARQIYDAFLHKKYFIGFKLAEIKTEYIMGKNKATFTCIINLRANLNALFLKI